MILSINFRFEDGTLTHLRKVFEIENGKKLKPILQQRFWIHHHNKHPAVKPHFIPVEKSYLNQKRAKFVSYINDIQPERDEKRLIETIRN